ncbi:MAG: serine hydrolase, partial [Candidatus Kryptoniota bacterium]
AILVEEGKIDWDEPVINYLPWFRMSDPYVTSQLTVRDLLVHRSGLGLGAGDLLWWPQSDYTRSEIVRRLSFVPLATSFRSTFAYDNVLYLVAGELIKEVTGEPWEKFVKSHILDKVGMTGTIDDISFLSKEKNVASPHAIINNKLMPVKPYTDPVTNPAGGICSNAADIARWMIVQLDSGRVQDSVRIFHPSTSVQLWSLITPIKVQKVPDFLSPMQRNFYGYGLGFFISDYRGYKLVSHTGSLPGYASQIALIPALKLGVAILTNQESVYAFKTITYHILDYYLGVTGFDWMTGFKRMKTEDDSLISAAERASAAERDSLSGPSLPLQKYAGRYRDAWYGDVLITYQNGRLTIKFSHTPQLTGELIHWQYDTFLAVWTDRELRADAFVTFALNADGSIDQAKMKPFSPATDFSFDFQDLLLKPVHR